MVLPSWPPILRRIKNCHNLQFRYCRKQADGATPFKRPRWALIRSGHCNAPIWSECGHPITTINRADWCKASLGLAMGELVIMYAYPGFSEDFERLSLFWDRTAQIISIGGQWMDFFF
jgi:hypothetical protein